MAMSSAQAHLMVAQHGTINVEGQRVYLVLAVPVSVFADTDDDGDGRMSEAELLRHHGRIERRVLAGLQLDDGSQQIVPTQALLSLSPPDDPLPHGEHGAHAAPSASLPPSQHLVVLAVALFDHAPQRQLSLKTDLFGRRSDEQVLHITATRGREIDTAQLRLEKPRHQFFASRWRAWAESLLAPLKAGLDRLLR